MTIDQFARVQQLVEEANAEYPDRMHGQFLITEVGNLLDIDLCQGEDGSFGELLTVLCRQEVAERIRNLKFHSPDVGANGTREWDFTTLVESAVVFPNLHWLLIETYDGVGNNHPIIESSNYSFQENGTLGKLLTKAPQLKFLTSPSAPDAGFFKREKHPLERLMIQSGYDTQNFVLNFSQSDCFPELWRFEYTDYNERYIDDWRDHCTPYEHFEQLFKSKAFDSIKTFVWHDPIYSAEQLSALKDMRPKLHFKVIRTSVELVRTTPGAQVDCN